MLINCKKIAPDFSSSTSFSLICGVDEAGRGPLVGSVVAAAVILDPEKPIQGLKDSKKLTAKVRENLFDQIINSAKAWSIAESSSAEIDELNILQATMLAMKRAIEGLCSENGQWPDLALIDGNRCPHLPINAEAIIKGDAKEPAISAASILAKVTRDRQMMQMHQEFPQYGFNEHMGYPTVKHIEAINFFGVCPEHRKTFGPIKRHILNEKI
jgi:ribonuclease HII